MASSDPSPSGMMMRTYSPQDLQMLQDMVEKLQVLSAHETRIESLVVRLLKITDGHEIHELAKQMEAMSKTVLKMSLQVDDIHARSASPNSQNGRTPAGTPMAGGDRSRRGTPVQAATPVAPRSSARRKTHTKGQLSPAALMMDVPGNAGLLPKAPSGGGVTLSPPPRMRQRGSGVIGNKAISAAAAMPSGSFERQGSAAQSSMQGSFAPTSSFLVPGSQSVGLQSPSGVPMLLQQSNSHLESLTHDSAAMVDHASSGSMRVPSQDEVSASPTPSATPAPERQAAPASNGLRHAVSRMDSGGMNSSVGVAPSHYSSGSFSAGQDSSALEEGGGHQWVTQLELRREMEDAISMARRPSFGGARRKSNSFLQTGGGGSPQLARTKQGGEDLFQSMGSDDYEDGRCCLLNGCQTSCRAINPTTPLFVLFQCMSIGVLLWDLFTIPFLLAWYQVVNQFTTYCGVVSASFWSTDIIMNFFVGYYKEGELVTKLRKVMKKYFLGWFLPDVIIVLSDWTSLVLGNTSSFKLVRLFKIVRLLRILVIFRLARLWRVMKEKLDHNLSENSRLLIRILSLCSMVLVLNHVLACMWFGVGRHFDTDTGARWTDVVWFIRERDQELAYLESSIPYQYTTALHWAVAQITLGANEINATNTNERIMQVLCLILGLICGSTFISSLSAAVFDYHAMHEDQKRSIRLLRRYLQQHQVDWRTCLAVQRQVAERAPKNSQILKEEDVDALNLLAPAMRLELTYIIQKARIMQSDILKIWTCLDVRTVWQICGSAAKVRSLDFGDELFDVDQDAESCFLVTKGSVIYTQDPDGNEQEESVSESMWMAEAGLWVEWQHTGAADSGMGPAEVFEITIAEFLKAMQSHPLINKITADYGRQFHRHLTRAVPPLHSLPSDTKVPGCDPINLVLAMGRDSRVQLSSAILENTRQTRFDAARFWGEVKELRAEVSDGHSVLLLTEAEEVVRVQSMVVLKIHVDARAVLVELGRAHKGIVTVTGQLPQCKKAMGEMLDDTLDRMLREDLSPFRPYFKFEGSYREPLEADMKTTWGVANVVAQTVCVGHFEEDLSSISTGKPLLQSKPLGLTATGTGQSKRTVYQSGGSRQPSSIGFVSQAQAVQGLEEVMVYSVIRASDCETVTFYAPLSFEYVEQLTSKTVQEALMTSMQEFMLRTIRLDNRGGGSFHAIKESDYDSNRSDGGHGTSARGMSFSSTIDLEREDSFGKAFEV